jgi:hypothetical protein
MCFVLQDGLKIPILSRFGNLPQRSQKSRYLQRAHQA